MGKYISSLAVFFVLFLMHGSIRSLYFSNTVNIFLTRNINYDKFLIVIIHNYSCVTHFVINTTYMLDIGCYWSKKVGRRNRRWFKHAEKNIWEKKVGEQRRRLIYLYTNQTKLGGDKGIHTFIHSKLATTPHGIHLSPRCWFGLVWLSFMAYQPL